MKTTSLISGLVYTSVAVAGHVPDKGHDSYGKCIPQKKLEALLPKYINAFGGITDGGKQAREVFEANVKTYSQSIWWTIGKQDVVAAHSEADDFPPVWENLEQFIKDQTKPQNDPDQFVPGPVAYGCNTFSFYWKGDLSVPGIPSKGRANGIDIAFVNPDSGKVYEVYTEYNTLNQAYGWGAHITWSTNPTCCECPVPFDTTCKCPAAACK